MFFLETLQMCTIISSHTTHQYDVGDSIILCFLLFDTWRRDSYPSNHIVFVRSCKKNFRRIDSYNQNLLDIKVLLFDFGYNRYRRIILICKEKNLMFETISIDAIAIHHKMTKTWQCHNRERCSYYSRERCKWR